MASRGEKMVLPVKTDLESEVNTFVDEEEPKVIDVAHEEKDVDIDGATEEEEFLEDEDEGKAASFDEIETEETPNHEDHEEKEVDFTEVETEKVPVHKDHEEKEVSFDELDTEEEGVSDLIEAESGVSFDMPEGGVVHPDVTEGGSIGMEDFNTKMDTSQSESNEKVFTLTYEGEEIGLISEVFDGFDLPDEFFEDVRGEGEKDSTDEDVEAFGLSKEEAKEIRESVENTLKKPSENEQTDDDLVPNEHIKRFKEDHLHLLQASMVMLLTGALASCAAPGGGRYGGNNYKSNPYETTRTLKKTVDNTRKTVRNMERLQGDAKRLNQGRGLENFLRNLSRVLGSGGKLLK